MSVSPQTTRANHIHQKLEAEGILLVPPEVDVGLQDGNAIDSVRMISDAVARTIDGTNAVPRMPPIATHPRLSLMPALIAAGISVFMVGTAGMTRDVKEMGGSDSL